MTLFGGPYNTGLSAAVPLRISIVSMFRMEA